MASPSTKLRTRSADAVCQTVRLGWPSVPRDRGTSRTVPLVQAILQAGQRIHQEAASCLGWYCYFVDAILEERQVDDAELDLDREVVEDLVSARPMAAPKLTQMAIERSGLPESTVVAALLELVGDGRLVLTPDLKVSSR
jgi:hypothetical protein